MPADNEKQQPAEDEEWSLIRPMSPDEIDSLVHESQQKDRKVLDEAALLARRVLDDDHQRTASLMQEVEGHEQQAIKEWEAEQARRQKEGQ